MKRELRPWRPTDAKALACLLSDRQIQANLRDGLPYPYTEEDGADFIAAMLAADPDKVFPFAITQAGVLRKFAVKDGRVLDGKLYALGKE